MMTLKHIDVDGREVVVSLASVLFDPETKVLTGRVQDQPDQHWTHGRAYLMNEGGKTVGIYHLKQKEQQS